MKATVIPESNPPNKLPDLKQIAHEAIEAGNWRKVKDCAQYAAVTEWLNNVEDYIHIKKQAAHRLEHRLSRKD